MPAASQPLSKYQTINRGNRWIILRKSLHASGNNKRQAGYDERSGVLVFKVINEIKGDKEGGIVPPLLQQLRVWANYLTKYLETSFKSVYMLVWHSVTHKLHERETILLSQHMSRR
jgi:hypothetical protein